MGTFLAFEEARDQWREWSRDCRPADIPSCPDVTYKDEGWLSMADWLGYGREP